MLVEELNFRRASERLHVSQPTLSQTLQRLERQLGTSLIERSTRQSRLTAAGHTLHDRAGRLLADMRSLEEDVLSVGAGKRRQLRVGSVNPAMRALVPQILNRVHRSFPDVSISLEPLSSSALIRALREGRLDLAIVRTADAVPGFFGTPLMNDPLLAVLPTRHRLAVQPSVTVADLNGETFIMAPRARNPEFHDELVSLYRRRGCSPARYVEANGLHSQLALIGAEVGIAVQSLLYLDTGRVDVVFYPIGENLQIPLQVLTPLGDDSELTRCFVHAAQVRSQELIAELDSVRSHPGE